MELRQGISLVIVLRVVQAAQIQPQRVRHHAEAGQAHRGRAVHRVQRQPQPDEHARCQRNADDVIDEGPEQVLMDVAQRRAAEPDGGRNVQKRTFHQHHIRRVDGDVGARADGNAGIGGGEGGCIVDAVADHGDRPVFLQLTDDGLLAAGQHACHDVVDARELADGRRRARVVARQHDDADAHAAQLADGLRTLRLDGVRHGDEAEEPAVLRKQQRRLACLRERVRLLFHFLRQRQLRGHIPHAAAQQLRAQDRRLQTAAGDGGKILRGLRLDVGFLAALHDGRGQRMLAFGLERDGGLQQLLLRHAGSGNEIRDLRLAGGDGAGLVECDDARPARMLKARGRLEKDAVLRAHAAADHDGHRRGQTQRARAADDEHGDAARQREGEFAPDEQPHDRRHDGDRDDRRDEHACDLVSRLGDRRLRRRRVGDHADDLAERGVLADACGLTAQEAGAVDRRGRHAVAGRLVDRDALTGQGGFVDGARAVQHDAVDRDALARADDEDITLFDLRGGDLHLFAVTDDGRRLRREGHEALERVGGLALGPCLEQLADGDERQDHGGGFKVEFVHIRHGRLAAAVQLRVRHGKQRVHAPSERGRCAERDERIHVRRAAQQALCAADEKFLVDDHDDPGQQQLDKAHGDVVAVKPVRQRPVPHHVAHREIHQNEQERHGRDEPLFEMRRLVVRQRIGAGGGRGGLLPAQARAVACVLHGLDDGVGRGRALDAHGIGEQAHGA